MNKYFLKESLFFLLNNKNYVSYKGFSFKFKCKSFSFYNSL